MTYKLIDFERLRAFNEKLKTKYATKNDIPKKLSDLQNDTTHRLVTDTEKKKWNDKVSQSQITSDANATGSDKTFSVDFINTRLEEIDDVKLDQTNITDSYNGVSSDLVLSQKGAYDLMEWANSAIMGNIGFLDRKIPDKISQLTNDKNFKTESEIQQMIEKASSLKKEVVTSLPTTGKDDVIYLVQDPKGKDNNNYLEYLWLNGKYELIGSTQVDLSGYVRHEELNNSMNILSESLTARVKTIEQSTQNILDKDKDKAIAGNNGTGIMDNNTYTTPKYVNWLINLFIAERLETLEEVLEALSGKKLDKTDIQEFTQQELEEAFK